jgi:predicted permease
MLSLISEMKQAWRGLAKAPLFMMAAVLTLALGIGLDSAMLAVFDRLLLRPLPLEDLDTLVGVYEGDSKLGWTRNVISASNFVDLQRQGTEFEAMAAHQFTSVNLAGAGEGENERVIAGRVSHTFFQVLKVRPALGRGFAREEDHRNGPKVVVLTHEFWAGRFGADPSIVGGTVRLNGVPHEVIGVLPSSFHAGGILGGRLYVPMAFTEEELADRGRHSFSGIGRLKAGTTVAAADAQLQQVAQALSAQYPDTNETCTAAVAPLTEEVTQQSVPLAMLFISLASFLLLIACANVSNLILARGATRQHELAIRTALGAGRGALVRHLAIESLFLGIMGGLLSLAVAEGLVALMRHWFGTLPQIAELQLDGRVLAIALAVTSAAVVLSSLVPMWRLSRAAPSAIINEGSRGSGGRQQHRFQAALLAIQVGLSVVLLTGSGLMVRTLLNLQDVPLGIEPRNVLAASVRLPALSYPTDEDRQEFARRLRDRLEALPQVRHAAVSNSLPFWMGYGNWTYGIEGEAPASDQGVVWVHAVSPEYFNALGIPLKRGRFLEDLDAETCLINQTFVRRHWPEGEPLGKRVQLDPPNGPTCSVVGVVGDADNFNMSDGIPPQIYASLFTDEFQGNRFLNAILKTSGDPALLAGPVRAAVRELDPDLAAQPIRPLEQVLHGTLESERVATTLVAGFGALGLILAAVGLYGLVAFTVTRRTREMGIRQALGADARRLVRMILRQSMRQVWWGVGLGLVACLALGRTMASLLYGVTPTDIPTLAAAILLVVGVSLLAALLPAIRAASVHPTVALREE